MAPETCLARAYIVGNSLLPLRLKKIQIQPDYTKSGYGTPNLGCEEVSYELGQVVEGTDTERFVCSL